MQSNNPKASASLPMEAESDNGRVRVFVRVRPGGLEEARSALHIAEAARVQVAVHPSAAPEQASSLGDAAAAEAREFRFDGAFAPHSTQDAIFRGVGLPVLHECLQGVNATILAYGQTGSGKTYSLLHEGEFDTETGLLPRLVTSLFDHVNMDSASEYRVEAAAMQVYNDQVDDLLHPFLVSGGGQGLCVQDGGHVPELTWVTCATAESLGRAFSLAREGVVYAETKMNRKSSRSHAILQVRLSRRRRVPSTGANRSDGVEHTRSLLSVVDLAGSERVKRSGVVGVRLKEAMAINRSLLALGNVVSALATKRAHMPFRDSKLTRILETSIGGNCKTALLVCVSPAAENAHETVSALEFASRAMNIEVNARVNRKFDLEEPVHQACTGVDGSAEEPHTEAAAQTAARATAMRETLEAAVARAEAAEARAELVEARAHAAERAAVEWEARGVAAEAALEAAQREAWQEAAASEERAAEDRQWASEDPQRAAEALLRGGQQQEEALVRCRVLEEELTRRDEELTRASDRLQVTTPQLAEAELQEALLRRQLDSTEQQAERREAALLQQLGGAEEELTAATAAASQFRTEAEEARAVTVAQAAAAKSQEARAKEEAVLMADRCSVLEERYAAACLRQSRDCEARLRTNREDFERRLLAAKRRSDAELVRRVALIEHHDEDLQRMAELRRLTEEQQRELQELRGRLRRQRTTAEATAEVTLTRSRSAGGKSSSSQPRCEGRLAEQRRHGLLPDLLPEHHRTFRSTAALLVS